MSNFRQLFSCVLKIMPGFNPFRNVKFAPKLGKLTEQPKIKYVCPFEVEACWPDCWTASMRGFIVFLFSFIVKGSHQFIQWLGKWVSGLFNTRRRCAHGLMERGRPGRFHQSLWNGSTAHGLMLCRRQPILFAYWHAYPSVGPYAHF